MTQSNITPTILTVAVDVQITISQHLNLKAPGDGEFLLGSSFCWSYLLLDMRAGSTTTQPSKLRTNDSNKHYGSFSFCTKIVPKLVKGWPNVGTRTNTTD